tara:strand:- start:317 stop:553 length:237 start_codon:yes stop_codon:yes gene_type:complete
MNHFIKKEWVCNLSKAELRTKQEVKFKRLVKWAKLKALKNRQKDIKNNINVLNANYKPVNNNVKLYVVGYTEPQYNSR